MGEAKRRKLLDPSWGKSDCRESDKEAKEDREHTRLVSRTERKLSDLSQKLRTALLKEMEQLTYFQQDDLLKLNKDFGAVLRSQECEEDPEQWIKDFLEAAKPTVDPAVFEAFLRQVHLWLTLFDGRSKLPSPEVLAALA